MDNTQSKGILDTLNQKKNLRKIYITGLLSILALIMVMIWTKGEIRELEKNRLESSKTLKVGDTVSIQPAIEKAGVEFIVDTIYNDTAIIKVAIKKSNLFK